MFLLNSRLGLFVETCVCFSTLRYTNNCRHLFSRSYEANLPSSLMIIISTPEHFQPVYLCRFAVRSLIQLARGFSRQCGINRIRLFLQIGVLITFQGYSFTDFPMKLLYALDLAIHNPSRSTLLRHPITQMLMSGAGIFSLLSIAYSNWPRLRYRLTRGG